MGSGGCQLESTGCPGMLGASCWVCDCSPRFVSRLEETASSGSSDVEKRFRNGRHAMTSRQAFAWSHAQPATTILLKIEARTMLD